MEYIVSNDRTCGLKLRLLDRYHGHVKVGHTMVTLGMLGAIGGDSDWSVQYNVLTAWVEDEICLPL